MGHTHVPLTKKDPIRQQEPRRVGMTKKRVIEAKERKARILIRLCDIWYNRD
jgi:hypothetical protein